MSNPKRQPALSRVRENHPAATAAAAATGTDTQPATPPPPVDSPSAANRPAREGTTQLNVRIPVSLRDRAERGALALSAQEGRRIPLQQVVINAIDEYLRARGA